MIAVPADSLWRITDIDGVMQADVNVAARGLYITITYNIPVLGIPHNFAQTSQVVVNGTQFGVIHLAENNIHWTWTTAAGYAAVADENPLPATFPTLSTVHVHSTNAQAGDVYSLCVTYKEVSQ